MEGGEMKFEEKLKEEILEELDKKGFIGNEYENPNEEVTIDLVMEKYKQRVREVIDKLPKEIIGIDVKYIDANKFLKELGL